MKSLLLTSFLMFIAVFGFSQTSIINPDTVCYQTNGSIYSVQSLGPNYTYTWNISLPGIITSGQGSNVINVDWSAANPGLISNAVVVFATNNSTGCQSAPITLDVFIYNMIMILNPIGPFCEGASCINLIGNPGGGVYSGVGVNNSQFCPNNSGPGNFIITYTINQGGCLFSATTTATVNPLPILLPIQHN